MDTDQGMPTYEDALSRSSDRVPFANGTEWEAWAAGWCRGTCKPCRHDDIDLGGEIACPILEVALLNERTPAEWVDRRSALGPEMYRCTKYETAG